MACVLANGRARHWRRRCALEWRRWRHGPRHGGHGALRRKRPKAKWIRKIAVVGGVLPSAFRKRTDCAGSLATLQLARTRCPVSPSRSGCTAMVCRAAPARSARRCAGGGDGMEWHEVSPQRARVVLVFDFQSSGCFYDNTILACTFLRPGAVWKRRPHASQRVAAAWGSPRRICSA